MQADRLKKKIYIQTESQRKRKKDVRSQQFRKGKKKKERNKQNIFFSLFHTSSNCLSLHPAALRSSRGPETRPARCGTWSRASCSRASTGTRVTSWPSTSRPPRTATPSSRGSGTSLRLFPFSSILLILIYLWLLVGSVLLCLFCLLCLIIFVLSYLSRIFCLLHSMNFIVILFYPILLYFDILSFISSSKSLFFFFLFLYYLFIIFLFIYSMFVHSPIHSCISYQLGRLQGVISG